MIILKIFSQSNPSPHGNIYRFVTIRTQFIGFHKYEGAPNKVAFLRNSHRHKFYVEATIQVLHEDRELEFFIVQDLLDTEIIPYLSLQGLGSCESMAENIMWGLINTYGDHRNYYVEVSEDNENAGVTAWEPMA